MAMAVRVAFEGPDNQQALRPSGERPVDLVHLARQTMGDKALEAEILQMFARQARGLVQQMAGEGADIKALAHRLQGAAKAIGAFRVAVAGERVEADASDAAALAQLHAAVVEAENFITGLCR